MRPYYRLAVKFKLAAVPKLGVYMTPSLSFPLCLSLERPAFVGVIVSGTVPAEVALTVRFCSSLLPTRGSPGWRPWRCP